MYFQPGAAFALITMEAAGCDPASGGSERVLRAQAGKCLRAAYMSSFLTPAVRLSVRTSRQ